VLGGRIIAESQIEDMLHSRHQELYLRLYYLTVIDVIVIGQLWVPGQAEFRRIHRQWLALADFGLVEICMDDFSIEFQELRGAVLVQVFGAENFDVVAIFLRLSHPKFLTLKKILLRQWESYCDCILLPRSLYHEHILIDTAVR
jgi:hypothetical protein